MTHMPPRQRHRHNVIDTTCGVCSAELRRALESLLNFFARCPKRVVPIACHVPCPRVSSLLRRFHLPRLHNDALLLRVQHVLVLLGLCNTLILDAAHNVQVALHVVDAKSGLLSVLIELCGHHTIRDPSKRQEQHRMGCVRHNRRRHIKFQMHVCVVKGTKEYNAADDGQGCERIMRFNMRSATAGGITLSGSGASSSGVRFIPGFFNCTLGSLPLLLRIASSARRPRSSAVSTDGSSGSEGEAVGVGVGAIPWADRCAAARAATAAAFLTFFFFGGGVLAEPKPLPAPSAHRSRVSGDAISWSDNLRGATGVDGWKAKAA